jgi:DtxR family Mn-dependent transcriptional regulator
MNYISNKLHGNQKNRISTEMYLKTIYLLREKHDKDPRPVDVVNELNLSKGSVSEMLKKLNDEKYIHYESYGKILLTDKGIKKAKNVLRKYQTVKKFLLEVLKIEDSNLHNEACNLEHAFSDKSIAKLNVLMKIWEQRN